jgi:hypothetical protein
MRNTLLIAVMALIMTSPLVLAEETDTPTGPRALSPAELDSVKGGQVSVSVAVATAISVTNLQNVAIITDQQESTTTTTTNTVNDQGGDNGGASAASASSGTNQQNFANAPTQ